MEEIYKQRIGYKGKIDGISDAICKDFNLGSFVSNNLILMGYEDFNFDLQTTKGKYFVKVFANFRDFEDCKRYVDVIVKARESKVMTPRLFKSKQGYLHTLEMKNCKLRLSVMDFIDGKSYFGLSELPNIDEIKYLAHQASLINSINIKPKPVYDHWAIVNFLKEFKNKSKYLSTKDLGLIQPLTKGFKDLKIKELPHCFVHGDIIATNVMKDKNSRLWTIDFAVSNYYPRIQELAVLACNLFFNSKSKTKSEKNFKIGLEEYQKKISLTNKELKSLPTYIKLAHAMHVLCSTYERVTQNNNSKENKYWYQQGKAGLEQMLE